MLAATASVKRLTSGQPTVLMIGPGELQPVAEEEDRARQDRDDREADREVGEAAHLAEELLRVAEARQVLLVAAGGAPRASASLLFDLLGRDVRGGDAAVDGERRAVDVGGLVGGEEERRLGDLRRPARGARAGCGPGGAPCGRDRTGAPAGAACRRDRGRARWRGSPCARTRRRSRASSRARRPCSPCRRSAASPRPSARRTTPC